jgi:hypothetical protein
VAVLATVDEIGSTERTPLAEVRCYWFTPGIAERSSSPADLWGELRVGTTILAAGDQGGVIGKVRRMRAS